MNAFRVWLRPLGDVCRVRVDSVANAKWLLNRLSQSAVVNTSGPIGKIDGTSNCSFEVPCDSTLSRSKFEKLLAAIPEVKLMTGPECGATAGPVQL